MGLLAIPLVGCGQTTTTYVKSDTTLGRVVVYRNGVAYFERYAEVQGDSLKLNVPHDKVDDFLKSLTVVDAATGEPAPISYPSLGSGGSTIDMKVGVGKNGTPHKLKLSYVTEAPSWKPSYRVTVGKAGGKVDLQGWAIVDNTSGEDWKDVRLGVGASSAMSFRFDLKGLRIVERETLQENDLFAQAPPMGSASYGNGAGQPHAPHRVMGDMSDDMIAMAEQEENERKNIRESTVVTKSQPSTSTPMNGRGVAGKKPMDPNVNMSGGNAQQQASFDQVQRLAQSMSSNRNQIVVEGYATAGDKDKMGASLNRANKLRDQLVRQGVDPNRIVALGKGEQTGRVGGARVFEAPPPKVALLDGSEQKRAQDGQDQRGKIDEGKTATGAAGGAGGKDPKPASEPIGSSHFESATAMTVPKGTSAMVSILRGETEGEVVYLYDPESPRGNGQFPFRTLRFRNPTDNALESGPVTVFGEGKFVGEGLAEPIPAHSIAFVPFALDRQIVVEKKNAERDEIARIITVNRGVFSTEIKHTKKATFTLYNRMGEKASVYIKHTVQQGYKLTKFPDTRSPVPGATDGSDHLAGANLFRVDLEPNTKVDVDVEEATPVFRTTDIRSPAGLDLVRVYLSNAAVEGPLKAHFEQLLKLNADMVKIEQQIQTAHEQMAEYRTRMDELHAQLVTLKAVKTAGPLMTHLEKKLQEVSEQMSKSTVEVVTFQEKLMVARVQFQSGVGDLSLHQNNHNATATPAAPTAPANPSSKKTTAAVK
jgi:outer membrane protein OmpA-like peptidoglycan-associated protein